MRPILALLLLLLLVAAPVSAQECELTIYCEYPEPKKHRKGATGGLIYDQVWELMRRTDIDKAVTTVTWKRGYDEALNQPCVGLFPTTRTPDREALFHWIGPILRVDWAFYALKDSGISITSLEDASQVPAIGTYANDSKEMWLKKQGFANLVSVMDNLTNMRKLFERRIDLMVGSPGVTDRWPELYGFPEGQLTEVYTFKTVDLYLAVSLGTPERTVEALRTAFAAMLRDGTVRTLYAKWVPGMRPPVASP